MQSDFSTRSAHTSRVNLDEDWRARREAERCLGCYDAPCIAGCPARIDIPEFIGRIRTENLDGAYQTLVRANPLPAICGLVCPPEYLCEAKCILTRLTGRPVAIAALQRYVCRQAQAGEAWPVSDSTSIAVVGGGPGGIACAVGLRRLGYDVHIYDEHERLGGLLTYSIPNYRLPDRSVDGELRRLEHSGIRFHPGEQVDAASLRRLVEEYPAVFLGIGLGAGKALHAPGTELGGVWAALDYLEAVRRAERGEGPPPGLAGHVLVIGGGNVALDAACVAAVEGASGVSLVYRRSKDEMLAWESEYLDALSLGVEFHWLTDLSQVLGEAGKVTGVRLHRMRLLTERDSSGRRKVEPVEQSEEDLACQAVILAVGQALDFEGLEQLGIELEPGGTIKTDPHSFQTSRPGVFAGGDVVRGGSYVVQAIADGMQAAVAIHRYLVREG